EEYLPAQLSRIAKQSQLTNELAILDACSCDRTQAMIREFAESAPFRTRAYQNQQNVGSTANFANAIQHCRNEIIVLADQDDVWYPDKLAAIVEVFARHEDVGVVFSDADVVDHSLQPLGYT